MDRPSRAPSMHDVAARAGVSHQTVSRVLNDFPGIRPATRQRVLDAIAELGYRRNVAARSLATGRSQIVGVLAPDEANYGPVSSFYAVERALRSAGFQPLATVTSDDEASITDALAFLLDHSIEALVLMAPTHSVLEVADAAALDLPVAYLLTGDERAPWSASVDQARGVELAITHLIEQGHRRIQHVAGPFDSTEAQLRRAEFDRIVAAHGLEALEVLGGSWSAEGGHEAAAHIDPRATAVFCANDQLAIGVTHRLAQDGVVVPRDLSVVGYDDIPEAAYMIPSLTTVYQDFRGVGTLAVRAIVAALQGGEHPDMSPLAPQLVVRSSVAPPRD